MMAPSCHHYAGDNKPDARRLARFAAGTWSAFYAGAVAVLSLSCVRMPEVASAGLGQASPTYLPVGAVSGAVVLVELLLVVGAWTVGAGVPRAIPAPIPPIDTITN